LTAEHPTNRVLAALAHGEGPPGWAHLERIELGQGHTLLAPRTPIEFMYFPDGALVGLMHAGGPDGAEAPVALVGHDGVVGVAPLLGAADQRIRAEVLHPGLAWRLPVAVLNSDPWPGKGLLRVVLRYLQALNAQMSQAALCQLQHTPHQRMGRWLQDAFERVPATTLRIDPATLGTWLGVAPKALAQATAQWVADGAILQGAHGITLLDRSRLAQRSCDCHQRAGQQTEPLLPPSA
jgi:CRP-like cAMP-binding protein